MPGVETAILIPAVSRETIWNTLVAFDQYPRFMDDVLDVQWLERSDEYALSTWTVLLNGSELSWTEADVFTPMEKIEFRQTVGDIEKWEGAWTIHGRPDELTVSLTVEFDIGIPSLADILHPIGSRAIKANCRQMLDGLRRQSIPA